MYTLTIYSVSLEPGDTGIYVSNEVRSDVSEAQETRILEPDNKEVPNKSFVRNELANAILNKLIGKNWNQHDKKCANQSEIGVETKSENIYATKKSEISRKIESHSESSFRNVLICGGRLTENVRQIIRHLSSFTAYKLNGDSGSSAYVQNNISLTFLGMWANADEDYIRSCFEESERLPGDYSSHYNQRLRFVRGDATSSKDLIYAGIMAAEAAIIVDPSMGQLHSKDQHHDPLLEDM